MALYKSIRELFTLKSIIKEVIERLGIDSEKQKLVSSSTVYDDNNGAIVLAKITRMNPTSKQISINYLWFGQHVGKEFVTRKIDSENQRVNIFTQGLQGELFVIMRKLICGW